MAALVPSTRWEGREVSWTWVPQNPQETALAGRALLAEFVGTLLFVFAAGSSLIVNQVTDGALGLLGVAISIAVAYAIIVSATHLVSGGHINPAVTIGMLTARRIPLSMALA